MNALSPRFDARLNALMEDSKLLAQYPGMTKAAALSKLTGVSEHGVRYWLREGIVPRIEPLQIIADTCLKRMGVKGLSIETIEWLKGERVEKPYEQATVVRSASDPNLDARILAASRRIAQDKHLGDLMKLRPELLELMLNMLRLFVLKADGIMDDAIFEYVVEQFVKSCRKMLRADARKAG